MFPLKAFYWGQQGARENFSLQIRNIVELAYRALGEIPVIIGECGIPMDMKYLASLLVNGSMLMLVLSLGEAFKSEDFTWQMCMMDAMMTALERSPAGFTF